MNWFQNCKQLEREKDSWHSRGTKCAHAYFNIAEEIRSGLSFFSCHGDSGRCFDVRYVSYLAALPLFRDQISQIWRSEEVYTQDPP